MAERDETAAEHAPEETDAVATAPVQSASDDPASSDSVTEALPPLPPTPPLPPKPPLPEWIASPSHASAPHSGSPSAAPLDAAPVAGAPIGVAQAAPASVRSAPTWLNGGALGSSVLAGALALGFALVASIVVILLTLLFAVVAGTPSTGSAGGSSFDLGSLQVGGVPFLGPVVWLATLGLFGQLSAGLSVTMLGTTGSLQVYASFVPVIVLVAAAVGGAWWSYRSEARARTTSRGGVWALAGASGLTAGVIAILLALLGRTTVTAGGGLGSSAFEVSTITAATFFGPLVTIGLAAVIGRWLARGASARHFGQALWHAPSRFRWGFRDVYDYLVVLTLIFVPASFALVLVAGNGFATAWPAGVGLISVLTAAVGHLGGYSATWSAPGAASGGSTLSLFTQGMQPLAWLLVALAVAAVFVAAILVARRRAVRPAPLRQVWVLPALTLAAAIAIGLTVGGGYAFGSANMVVANANISLLLTPALWTYALALVWAAAVEAVARWVAPTLLATWPALTRWRVAGDGIVAAADSAPATPAGAVPAGAAPLAPAASGPVTTLSPGARRGVLIGGIVVGALVVIAVVGGIVISTLQNTVFSPKTVVQGYVDDIAAGRFASAGADSGVESGEGTELLDAEQVDLNESMSNVVVGDPTGAGASRSVPVSFTLSGEPDSAEVTLQSAGKQFLFFDSWTIVSGLETEVQVYASGIDEVSVGGVAVPVVDGIGVFSAYPAVYPVEGPESQWVTVEAEPLAVSSFGGTLSVEGTPSPAMVAEVQRQVDEDLDTCATSDEADPEGCPFSLYSWTGARNVSWSITEYPTVELTGVDSFYASDGEASATYEEQDFFGESWSAEESDVSMRVSGDIAIDDDVVTVTLRSY